MASHYSHYRFFSSSEVELELKVHVTSLDCKHLQRTLMLGGGPTDIDAEDLVIRAHICNQGVEHSSMGQATQQLPVRLGSSVHWRGWLTLPVRISELSRDSELVLTVWAPTDVIVGGCRISLFDELLRLRQGLQQLVLWPHIIRPTKTDPKSDEMSAAEAAAEFVRGLHGVRPTLSGGDALDDAAMAAAAVAAGDVDQCDVDRHLDVAASLVPGIPASFTPSWLSAASQQFSASAGDGDAKAGQPLPPGDSSAEMMRLVKAKEEYDVGVIQHMPWLDRLTLSQLSSDHRAAEDEAEALASGMDAAMAQSGSPGAGLLPEEVSAIAARRHPLCSFIKVELPVFSYPVVYDSSQYADAALPAVVKEGLTGPAELEEDGNAAHWMRRLVTVLDPDAGLEHPVEAKFAKLGRLDARRAGDPTAKPSPIERMAIDAVLRNSAIPAATTIGDLLWRYRFTLLREDKAAVLRFVECVDWQDAEEVADATAMPWAAAAPEDVLRLLGRQYSHPFVREYAIRCLGAASDSELSLFMLQLVQAVRYEPGIRERVAEIQAARNAGTMGGIGAPATPAASPMAGPAASAGAGANTAPASTAANGSGGAGGLGGVAGGVEAGRRGDDETVPGDAGGAGAAGAAEAEEAAAAEAAQRELSEARRRELAGDILSLSPLTDFLVARSAVSTRIATKFHWFVTVETENEQFGLVFNAMYEQFINVLQRSAVGKATLDEIHAQSTFINGVLSAVRDTLSDPGLRAEAKTEKLVKGFSPGGRYSAQAELFAPVIMPLDPRVRVCGIAARRCLVFKSSVSPARISLVIHDSTDPGFIAERFGDEAAAEFRAIQQRRERAEAGLDAAAGSAAAGAGGDEVTVEMAEEGVFDPQAQIRVPGATRWVYNTLFKIGDDVRQDQLVLQLLALMDRRFKRLSLDLCLTPYTVLATSTTEGILEFVEGATALDPIKHDILRWFREQPGNSDPEGLGGVHPSVIDRYTRSCAGYCVWTYVLGIGDRHLDNILVTKDGRLVHIDFGFAFGKDPKPLPPPLKLTRQMVEAMGGPETSHYRDFLNFACRAFNFTRQRGGLYMDLLTLMRDADLQSMGPDPDEALKFVSDKLRLDLNTGEAEVVMIDAIQRSVAALFPLLVDFIHTIATRMR